MHKLILILLVSLLMPCYCFAQKWSLGIQLGNAINCPQTFAVGENGVASDNKICLAYGFTIYRHSKKQSIWRVKMNWNRINFESSFNGSQTFLVSPNTRNLTRKLNTTQNHLIIAPGIYWEESIGKLIPRFGLEMQMHFSSPWTTEDNTLITFNSIRGEQQLMNRITTINKSKSEASSSIGVGGIIGFGYKIKKGLSIAVEFIPTISYQNHEAQLINSTNRVSITEVFFQGSKIGQENDSSAETTLSTFGRNGFRFDQHQLQMLIVYEF